MYSTLLRCNLRFYEYILVILKIILKAHICSPYVHMRVLCNRARELLE